MSKPYVQSNYERIKNDNYQTVDPRCVKALVESSGMIFEGQTIVDCCSDQGSGIVGELNRLGFIAHTVKDAFDDSIVAHWNIFNPPYTKDKVDKIIWHQIHGLEQGRFMGLALLVRNNFDFAKKRYEMFTHMNYALQVHMMFRPFWSTERKAAPIHNFVWHVWEANWKGSPSIRYWKESKPSK